MRPGNADAYPGLTVAETNLLGAIGLAKCHGNPVRPGMLANSMHVTKGALSQMLKSLEQAGMIRRMRSEEDSRSVDVELTQEGAKVIDWFHERRRAMFDSMVSYIGPEAMEQMIQTMERIIEFQEKQGFSDMGERGTAPCGS